MSSGIQLALCIILGLCFLCVTPLSVVVIKDVKELLKELEDDYDD